MQQLDSYCFVRFVVYFYFWEPCFVMWMCNQATASANQVNFVSVQVQYHELKTTAAEMETWSNASCSPGL